MDTPMGSSAPGWSGSHVVDVDLYRNAGLVGGTRVASIVWPAANCLEFYVPADPTAHYMLRLEPVVPDDGTQFDGWTYARAALEVNGGNVYGPLRPLSWYTAEPTDWPSGIVRWHIAAHWSGRYEPPVTYSALIRRPQ